MISFAAGKQSWRNTAKLLQIARNEACGWRQRAAVKKGRAAMNEGSLSGDQLYAASDAKKGSLPAGKHASERSLSASMLAELFSLGGVRRVLKRAAASPLEVEDVPPPPFFFTSEGHGELERDARADWDAAVASRGDDVPTGHALGWMLLKSQLAGPLRMWAFIGASLSVVGALISTVGKFLVLRRMINNNGQRIVADALLFAAILVRGGVKIMSLADAGILSSSRYPLATRAGSLSRRDEPASACRGVGMHARLDAVPGSAHRFL